MHKQVACEEDRGVEGAKGRIGP